MNDITKARYFLKANDSDLQHLESFALMLATAEQRYRDIQRRKKSNHDLPGALDVAEVEAALEYAALKYLKKHNQLPKNSSRAFMREVSLDEKLFLAREWANA